VATTVVNLRAVRYDPANPDHVYIGRANRRWRLPASKWANPFPLRSEREREAMLARYRGYLQERPDLRAAVGELRGRTLYCWCAPKPCHGDILAALADAPDAGPAAPGQAVDLAALVERARARGEFGPAWALESADLDVNALVLPPGAAVDEHVNAEVDVLLVGLRGDGVVEIGDRPQRVGPGTLVLIPKGARRAIRSGPEGLAYLTCHRRRAPLRPAGRRGPAGGTRSAAHSSGEASGRGRDPSEA
jgi:mannose-6-phosphate isomerase-like protein (cupin superfamily)